MVRSYALVVMVSLVALAPVRAGKPGAFARMQQNFRTARSVLATALHSGAGLREIAHGVITIPRFKLMGIEVPDKPYQAIVSPKLTRGSRPSNADLHRLKSEGYDLIIELTAETNASTRVGKTLGMDTLYLPIIDHTSPSFEQLMTIVEAVRGHKRAYIHCQGGKGRTGVAVAFYRMAVEGWSADRALKEAEEYGITRVNQIEAITRYGHALKILKNP